MSLNQSTGKLAEELVNFIQDKYGFDRLPSIAYIDDEKNSVDPLCRTGGYDQENEAITIYVTDRHPKDILRSLAHELLHHVQKCEGMMDGHDMSVTANPNYIMHDKFLKDVEADAFKRGNITFREWEATKKGEKIMSESKKMTKAQIVSKHKKAKKAMPSFVKQYGKEKGEKIAYATAMGGGMDEGIELEEAAKPDYLDGDGNTKEPMKKAAKDAKKQKDSKKNLKESEEKEVEVNEALKNSLYYVQEDRPLGQAYNMRDEKIYNELLKKFKIKK